MKPSGRQRVFDRDGGWCHYGCGERADTIDHIVPKSSGGPSCQWNLVGSCKYCNRFKSSHRGVCICFRCIEAERLFEGYSRPAHLVRRPRKVKVQSSPLVVVMSAKQMAAARRRSMEQPASLVCHLASDGHHVRAYSGMGDFCVRCSEVLPLGA